AHDRFRRSSDAGGDAGAGLRALTAAARRACRLCRRDPSVPRRSLLAAGDRRHRGPARRRARPTPQAAVHRAVSRLADPPRAGLLGTVGALSPRCRSHGCTVFWRAASAAALPGAAFGAGAMPWGDNPAMDTIPAASVIFTTYNQPDWLEKVLLGFAAQDRLDFEVLVADDGSDAHTATRLRALAPRLPMPVRHL